MSVGRPLGSKVRQNIVEILYFKGKAYGYEINKVYQELFPKVTQRLVYYHLKKGLETSEFAIKNIKKEKGNYSWGETAEKVYYTLGKNASPKIITRIKTYLQKKTR